MRRTLLVVTALLCLPMALAIVSHTASQVVPGQFGAGNYSFQQSVGIGTASPGEMLHVKSTTSNAIVRVDSKAGSNAGLTFYEGGVSKASYWWNAADGSLRFYMVGGGEAMIINNQGRVGIGTAAPALPLDVRGPSWVQGHFQSSSADMAGGIELWGDDNSSKFELQAVPTDSGTLPGGFLVYDRTDGAFRFVIDTNGNVGIGTTDPQARFHVSSGQIQMDNDWDIRWGASDAAIRSTSSNLRLFTSGSERVRIDSAGKVGINTTVPGVMLDVYGGQIRAVNGTITRATTGTGLELEYSAPSYKAYVRSYDRSASQYKNLTIEAATLTMATESGGNVGIGTAAPADRLDLGWDGNLRLTSNSWVTGAVRFFSRASGASTSNDYFIQRGGSDARKDYLVAHIPADAGSKFSVVSSGDNHRLTVDGSNGRVGIGKTAPDQQLDVSGGSIRTDTALLLGVNGGVGKCHLEAYTVCPGGWTQLLAGTNYKLCAYCY